MNVLDSYLKRLQSEQISTTSVSAGITPYESPVSGKPLIKSPKGRSVIAEADVEAPKRILVDFDVPVHKYSKGYFDSQIYDVPTEGSKEALQFLKNEGFEVIVFTTRVSQEEHPETYKVNEEAIRSWLDEHGIPFDRITSEKLLALAYIDDKSIRFADWKSALEMMSFLKIL